MLFILDRTLCFQVRAAGARQGVGETVCGYVPLAEVHWPQARGGGEMCGVYNKAGRAKCGRKQGTTKGRNTELVDCSLSEYLAGAGLINIIPIHRRTNIGTS